MPIIEIKSLPLEKNCDIPSLLGKLNSESATVLKLNKRHVWSYWQYIEAGHYAVGDETSLHLTQHSHSPIVKVISFEGRIPGDIENLLNTIALVLSRELEIDIGNIFIYYQEVTSGKVFDGGQIIRKR